MKSIQICVAASALALSMLAPAMAGSITAVGSSASSAGSASLKGSSNSIEGSSDGLSNSSSKDKTAMVKDGNYRVAAVLPAQAPGMLRLQLEPQGMADAQPFVLNVPAQAFGAQAPVAGDIVQAQRRDYGVQFAHAQTQEPFFLVLADAWNAELNSRPVTQ